MEVHLYAPALLKETQAFLSKVDVALLSDYVTDGLEFQEYTKSVLLVYAESTKYRNELATYLQKNKGRR